MNSVAPDRVDFYRVPLVCQAAPTIGCGSLAKPALVELERAQMIVEAWLNRPGTMMAVVWEENAARDTRTQTVNAALVKRKIAAQELKGDARTAALESFFAADGWYCGAEVDRLSEEEAGVIAARLVRRINAKSLLSQAQVAALHGAFEDAFKATFTRTPTFIPVPEQNEITGELGDALLQAGHDHLDGAGMKALQEALAAGYRPLPNEE